WTASAPDAYGSQGSVQSLATRKCSPDEPGNGSPSRRRTQTRRTSRTGLSALPLGQELNRIHRLAVAAYLEMQLHLVGVGIAHLGNLLPLGDVLPLFHQQLVVVGVDAQKRAVVLDDDQLAEAADPRAAEDDFPRRAREHRLPGLSGDTDAFAAIVEARHDLAACRPAELRLVPFRD